MEDFRDDDGVDNLMALVATPGMTSVRLTCKFEGWCVGISGCVCMRVYVRMCVLCLVFRKCAAILMWG